MFKCIIVTTNGTNSREYYQEHIEDNVVIAQKDVLGETNITRPLHDSSYLFSNKVKFSCASSVFIIF